MSRIAPALMASAAKGLAQGQPGSNGYWRRDQFVRPGTYTWTAKKDGKIKIQALGAAAGANGARPGASAGFGEKTLSVSTGDVLTLVLGEGGLAFNGNSNSVRSSAGGSTSISGSPVGGTPLVLTGAIGSTEDTTLPGTAGGGTGPWDVIFSGAVAIGMGRGSPSSGSPFGPGIAPDGYGGAGWVGTTSTVHGGGSKTSANEQSGGSGMTTFATAVASGNTAFRQGSAERARPFWDLRDVDSAGGTSLKDSAGNVTYAEDAGPGAGGSGAQVGTGGASALGGGSGFCAGFPRGLAGFGAGGAGSNNPTNVPLNGSGSKGGNAFIQIFWDEVA